MGNKKVREKVTVTTSEIAIPKREGIIEASVSLPDMDVDQELEAKVAECFQNKKIRETILSHCIRNARKSRLPSSSILRLRSVCRCFWMEVDLILRDEGESIFGIGLYEGATGTTWVDQWSQKSVSEKCQELLRLIRRRRILIGDIPWPFFIRVEARGPLCCDIVDLLIQLCPRDVVKIYVQEPTEDILERLEIESATIAPYVKKIQLLQPREEGEIYMPRYDNWLQGIINRCSRLKTISIDRQPLVMRVSRLVYPPTLEHLETTYCPPETFGFGQPPLPKLRFLRLYGTTALSPQPDIIPILSSCAGTLQEFEFISISNDPAQICNWEARLLPRMKALKTFLMEAPAIQWSNGGIDPNPYKTFPVLDSITIISKSGGAEAFADAFVPRGSPMITVRKLSVQLQMKTGTGNFPFVAIKKLKHYFVNLQVLNLTIRTRFATIIRTIFAKLNGLRVLSLRFLVIGRDGGHPACSTEFEALIIGTNIKYLVELRDNPELREGFLNTARSFPDTASPILLASIREMTSLRKFSLLGYVFARINNGIREESRQAINLLQNLSFELGFAHAPMLTDINLSGSFNVSYQLQERWRSRGDNYTIHVY